MSVWKEAQEGGDICIHMADSSCCAAEINTILKSNYTPIKKIFKALKSLSWDICILQLAVILWCSTACFFSSKTSCVLWLLPYLFGTVPQNFLRCHVLGHSPHCARARARVCVCVCVCVSHLVMSDSATPWTVVHQVPLPMEFSRQEYWSGLPCPSPGDFPDPGIDPVSPALQVYSLPFELPGKLSPQ